MTAAQPFESLPVELTEWSKVGSAQDDRLKGLSLRNNEGARRLAEALHRRLDIREGYDGIEITSTSFVGRVDVGNIRVAIRPKLPAMPLARLLRYAYGLRDVAIIEETGSPATRHGLHDLLIALLAAEVEELLHRGLARRYVPLSEKLESPRGRILISDVIREGGIREARLPCRHVERRADWHLNRVLRAGLTCAGELTEDRGLRQRLHQLSAMFGDVERIARLCPEDIDLAERGLSRLTDTCRPALTIIRLLQDALGISFDSAQPLKRMPGFLFDMNAFFQRLVSRFLHDNLASARITDEIPIRGLFAYTPDANPKRRKAPSPRPDYALFRDKELKGFLDAKYRDIWDNGLPAEWLYQLSIYALASPSHLSTLLYASMAEEARDERLEVRHPIAWSRNSYASVIVRPVPLVYLAELLNPDRTVHLTGARRELAKGLVASEVRKYGLASRQSSGA